MQEILVLNDHSEAAQHAAGYAFQLACQYNKNLLVANLSYINESIITTSHPDLIDDQDGTELSDYLAGLPPCHDFQPGINRLDISSMNEQQLARELSARGVWIVVQGTNKLSLNLQALLNRSLCPFMLVPADAEIRPLERIAYLADLRYAQVPVINFLSRMNSGNEKVILTHICAKGLPELDQDYAVDLFSNGLNRSISYERLYLSRMRERDFNSCVDQVIHGMQADLLVCSNHHYHFERMLGGNIASSIPAEINIPILVFPH